MKKVSTDILRQVINKDGIKIIKYPKEYGFYAYGELYTKRDVNKKNVKK